MRHFMQRSFTMNPQPHAAHEYRLNSFLYFMIAILTLALAACATVEPPRPPEVRTTIVEMKIIVPVPCFSEAERPVPPTFTPIDIDHATVDQMAAALAADDIADQLFARAVDALFILCQRRIADGTATTPVGVKP